MRDPFRPNSNKQLVREAQMGFAVIGALVALLIYVAWYRLGGFGDEISLPDRNSAVAQLDQPSHAPTNRTDNQFSVASEKFEKPLASTAKPVAAILRKPAGGEAEKTVLRLGETAESLKQTAQQVGSFANSHKHEIPFAGVAKNVGFNQSTSGVKPKPTVAQDSAPVRVLPDVPKRIASTESLPKLALKPTDSGSGVKPQTEETSNPLPASKPDSMFKLPANVSSSFKPIPLPSRIEEDGSSVPVVTKPESNPVFQPLKSSTEIEPKLETKLNSIQPATENKTLAPLKPAADFNTSGNQRLTSTKPSLADLRPQKNPIANPLQKPKTVDTTVVNEETPKSVKGAQIAPVGFEETIEYEIKAGDSFWSIAHERYGDGRLFSALYLQNETRVPGFEDLTPGVRIEVPSRADLIRRWRGDVPADIRYENDPQRVTPEDVMEKLTSECDENLEKRFYVTLQGDTLFAIAGQRLGQASRYVELIELNQFRLAPDTDFMSPLPKGLRLVLPE